MCGQISSLKADRVSARVTADRQSACRAMTGAKIAIAMFPGVSGANINVSGLNAKEWTRVGGPNCVKHEEH